MQDTLDDEGLALTPIISSGAMETPNAPQANITRELENLRVANDTLNSRLNSFEGTFNSRTTAIVQQNVQQALQQAFDNGFQQSVQRMVQASINHN